MKQENKISLKKPKKQKRRRKVNNQKKPPRSHQILTSPHQPHQKPNQLQVLTKKQKKKVKLQLPTILLENLLLKVLRKILLCFLRAKKMLSLQIQRTVKKTLKEKSRFQISYETNKVNRETKTDSRFFYCEIEFLLIESTQTITQSLLCEVQ